MRWSVLRECKGLLLIEKEYVPGGDFRTLLNNSGVLKEEHARFYAAEMFAGVNELHKLGYIHRDLKPEVCQASVSGSGLMKQNFLVDGTGHVKLTDFGLATGSLNPQKIEDMKAKVRSLPYWGSDADPRSSTGLRTRT